MKPLTTDFDDQLGRVEWTSNGFNYLFHSLQYFAVKLRIIIWNLLIDWKLNLRNLEKENILLIYVPSIPARNSRVRLDKLLKKLKFSIIGNKQRFYELAQLLCSEHNQLSCELHRIISLLPSKLSAASNFWYPSIPRTIPSFWIIEKATAEFQDSQDAKNVPGARRLIAAVLCGQCVPAAHRKDLATAHFSFMNSAVQIYVSAAGCKYDACNSCKMQDLVNFVSKILIDIPAL